jgi:hypothetical protein
MRFLIYFSLAALAAAGFALDGSGCDSGYFGSDCSETAAYCAQWRCSSLGQCTERLAGCDCNVGYGGTDCSARTDWPAYQSATADHDPRLVFMVVGGVLALTGVAVGVLLCHSPGYTPIKADVAGSGSQA